ncbi:MAG TPA: YfhO family protein [Thermoanaerobaculia bacterium]|nr:YfhO family protein [Thermoanaerobaculia bacterium]
MQGRGTTGRTALLGGALGLAFASFLLVSCVLSGGVPARGDLADFFWPVKAYTAMRWPTGVPLWNPLSGCGEPWLAQLQTGVFYPGDLPFFLPGIWGPLLGIALHLVIASSGMAAWLSGLGASRAGSLLGAAVFAGGGGFLSLALVYNNFETASFLPWLFVAARHAVRGGSPAGLAVSFSLAFLGGEPALAAVGAAAAAVVAFATRGDEPGPSPRGLRGASRLVGGLVLGTGLAAAAAIPFFEYAASSGRLTGVTRKEALARPVGPSDLLDLVLPPPEALLFHPSEGRGGYLATLALSPLVLLFAAGAGAGLAARPRLLVALSSLALAGLLLALGARGGLLPLLWDVGLARGVRFPARWFVFTQFALAGLSGAGLDGWLHGRFFRWPKGRAPDDGADASPSALARLVPAAIFGAAAVALLGAGAVAGRLTGLPAWAALVGAGVGATLLASARAAGRPGPRLAGILFVAIVAIPLALASASVFAPAPPARPLSAVADLARAPGRVCPVVSDASLLAALARETGGEWGGASGARARAALSGYTNLPLGVSSATSPSPIGNPRRTRLLGAALSGGDVETILALADVRHVVSPFPTKIPGARLETRDAGVLVYALPRAYGRVFFVRSAREADDDAAFRALATPDFDAESLVLLAPPAGLVPAPRAGRSFSVARVVRDAPEALTVDTDASEAGYLVLTRSHDRGWKARLDGADVPLRRANLALSAVLVPAGAHRIELVYRPASFRVGTALSAVSIAALAGLLLAGQRPL